jgi:hypothetical protein
MPPGYLKDDWCGAFTLYIYTPAAAFVEDVCQPPRFQICLGRESHLERITATRKQPRYPNIWVTFG